MADTVVRAHRTFEGMSCPESHPVTVRDRYVTRVHMFDIPTSLRNHAYQTLDALSGGEWWTVGEFLYTGESCYDVAVARRVMREGRMVIEYGVESAE